MKRAAALLAGLLAACASPAPDVALDVGHGLAESGARSASGVPEFQYNLTLAQRARLFLSIHHDSVKERLLPEAGRFSGFSLFVSHANPHPAASLACASAVGARLRAAGFPPSRYHADPGVGEGRLFADEANGVHWFDDLAVAASATMPAVLVEAGVIVNPAEERRLADASVQERFARAIAEGVEQCLS